MDKTAKRKGYRPASKANTAAKIATEEILDRFKEAKVEEGQIAPVAVVKVPAPAPKPVARKLRIARPKPVPKLETASDLARKENRFTSFLDTIYGEPKRKEGESEERYLRKYDERMMELMDKKIRLTDKKEKNPVLQAYNTAQKEHEEKGQYILDTTVFIPTTRRAFYPFIQETYESIFGLPARDKDAPIDPEACEKLLQSGKQAVEAFLYQKFIKEYMRQASPYRGILVYHGLGSGKTCTAIAASEALYGVANKNIIVMSPLSLRQNFIKEISKCGFRHFSTNNHWVKIKQERIGFSSNGKAIKGFPLTIEYFARSVLSLSEDFVNKLKENGNPIWIPDFTLPPNFDDSTQINPTERDLIRRQINESINNRIKFISYNGVSAAQLKEWACERVTKGKTIFDNSVIVIDEVHNLVNLMQGKIIPFLKEKEGGRPRKIPAEPVTPGPWSPKLCGNPELNYTRAFLFYRLLTDAKNAKIIALSGTPIINFPEELAILMNVLGGYIDSIEFSTNTNEAKMKELDKIINADPRVDLVQITPALSEYKVFVSIFQEGYVKVIGEDGVFKGVKFDKSAQESIEEIYGRIKVQANAKKINIGVPTYKSYPRLPPFGDDFRPTFIDQSTDSVINTILLKKTFDRSNIIL